MTDISGAMEAARRIVDIDEGTSHEEFVEYLDSVAVARFLLDLYPQRDGEGNRGLDAAASPVDPWQAISTAPKDGVGILLCSGRWITVGSWHRQGACWVTSGPTYERYPADEQPEFWQHAPSPPGADANQQSKTDEKEKS